MSNPPKFKLKKRFGSSQPPLQYVWIIHTNTDYDSADQSTFTTAIDHDSITVTLTVDAARQNIIAVADTTVNEKGWERGELRDTGEGIFEEGDLCCDVGHSEVEGDALLLKSRVIAWRFKITE